MIVYAGTMSAIRGLEQMLDLIGRLPAALGAELTLIGRFASPEAKAMARGHPSWAKVRYLGEQPWSRVIDEAAIARAIVELATDPERAAAMGEAGPRAAFAGYGWGSQEVALLGLYGRVAHAVPPEPSPSRR